MFNNEAANLDFYDINVLNQMWKKGSFFRYDINARPYCGICFVVSGKIKYKTKEKDITALPGDVVVLKKHSEYKAEFCECNTRDILINFQCENHNGEKNFSDISEGEITVFKNRADLQKNFIEIFDYDMLLQRKCMVKSKLYQIMDEICTSEPKNAVFKQIKQIIDNDTDFKLNESEFAAKCGVSISTLQRTFKKNCGKTVSEYRSELKMQKAKELLSQNVHTTEEIAEILGFCDNSHFSKSFKKHVGVSPKKYSNQH